MSGAGSAHPIGEADALRVLIGCLLAIDSVDAADRTPAFQTVAAALERLPVSRLSVGTAAEGVPAVIDALLGRLGRDARVPSRSTATFPTHAEEV